MIDDSANIVKNIVDASTLMVTMGPPSGGSSFCSLNWTNVQRIPPHVAAPKQSKNPFVSNSTSPKAVKISPAVIKNPTIRRLQVIGNRPNMKPLSSVHTGPDDFTMVKNVTDIRTRERFDKAISAAVTNPQGIEIPK
mmetsp:Transcript_9238/g.20053  ORF Transcript_9238/g.20053 Transcript_9238/m.20053 type:complete len:137 (+) Transcript_9238:978-1388(+)